jgi:hypothetical protein
MTLYNQLIATGNVLWNDSQIVNGTWTLSSGDQSDRSISQEVLFANDQGANVDQYTFTATSVVVALTNIDADTSRGIRIDVSASNLQTDPAGGGGGFTLTMATWYNSIIHGIGVQCFVYGNVEIN